VDLETLNQHVEQVAAKHGLIAAAYIVDRKASDVLVGGPRVEVSVSNIRLPGKEESVYYAVSIGRYERDANRCIFSTSSSMSRRLTNYLEMTR
jgi:hypothetical protein